MLAQLLQARKLARAAIFTRSIVARKFYCDVNKRSVCVTFC
jgi:hypothetical protein